MVSLAEQPAKIKERIFKWMVEQQEVSDAIKEAPSITPVLGSPIFSKELIPETDTFIKGLSAILSQQGEDCKICVTVYASQSLCPSEISMHNYGSAKLELLALKWTITHSMIIYYTPTSKYTCTITH